MKKVLSVLILLIGASLCAHSQNVEGLTPPVQTDTLTIVSVKYNYNQIRQENWPCQVIYQSVDRFEIDNKTFFIKSVSETGFNIITIQFSNCDKQMTYEEITNGGICIQFDNYEFTCVKNPPAVNSLPIQQESIGDTPPEAEEEKFIVETKPSFQGGDANDFSRWVNRHLVYHAVSKKNGVQGRVILNFTITTEGEVEDVEVLNGVDPLLDAEAVRVVSSSPKWKPGEQDGKPVKVTYTFPVIFQLR